MKYFVFDNERNGSCYLEFFKGKWDKKTFWKEDSICLEDNLLYDHPDFAEALIEVASFDIYANTEISIDQWKEIGHLLVNSPDIDLYNEANIWLVKVFEEYNYFTILGL